MNNFNFKNLTESVRKKMISEVKGDISSNKLYFSDRLNALGKRIYTDALLSAITDGSEFDLQQNLESENYFNSQELRNGKSVKVPSNAAQLLAQSEFNRFYIRGVCLQAIEEGISQVEVYRARESSWSRPESERKIGTKINPNELLNDLREHIGREPLILPEVNSGLSIKY